MMNQSLILTVRDLEVKPSACTRCFHKNDHYHTSQQKTQYCWISVSALCAASNAFNKSVKRAATHWPLLSASVMSVSLVSTPRPSWFWRQTRFRNSQTCFFCNHMKRGVFQPAEHSSKLGRAALCFSVLHRHRNLIPHYFVSVLFKELYTLGLYVLVVLIPEQFFKSGISRY